LKNDLKITYVPLTSEDRVEAIASNKADIECGTTTMTLSREEKVDFTLMTFAPGSLLTLAGSGIGTTADPAASLWRSSPARRRSPRSRAICRRR
jgi:ABC-type amino acid transport substrate-binding protein